MRYLPLALFLLLPNVAPAAELLTFQGTFVPVKVEEGEDADKRFTIHAIVAGEQLAWTLTESRRGAWPWTERFGLSPASPSLLYDRGDGFSAVPLPELRLVSEKPLTDGAEWKQGGLQYRVTGEGRRGDIACWEVAARDAYGPRRTLWVSQADGLVVELDERVVIGQGRDCRLRWKLTERSELKDAEKHLSGFVALAEVRAKLAVPPQSREIRWTAEQVALLQTALPEVAGQVDSGPLSAIVEAAQKDVATQSSRGDALAALAQKALDKTPERFELSGTAGEKLAAGDLKGQITVLHFWDYRDTQEEPYGQVGYLDFLARQQKGVKVYGVAVDDRLADGNPRSATLSGARKVKSFMNLSYPVLIDDGGLLKQIGDPRATGAKLPVWVVIGKDGKVQHYHVGFYEVQRDQGLAELNDLLQKP